MYVCMYLLYLKDTKYDEYHMRYDKTGYIVERETQRRKLNLSWLYNKYNTDMNYLRKENFYMVRHLQFKGHLN